MKRTYFTLYTLINIKPTLNKNEASTKNFLTLLNGIGLHVQPLYDNEPIGKLNSLDKHKFGSEYTGRKKVYAFEFYVEGDRVVNVELANRAINNMPVLGKKYDSLITADVAIKNTYIKQVM